ncbi:MAG: SDR family oxidoreductase [Acidimicrobiia bacterium]|nr:SDR family oxidoreductase [Acidimicrobiia bacterium]
MVTPDDLRLDGRVAVVTGAAIGIGRAVATTLAAFGADLALCDRDTKNLAYTAATAEALGRDAVRAEADVRDEQAVSAFLDATGEHFGGVDILVNNAGGGFAADFLDVSAKGEAALVAENFTSVTNLVRATVPLMEGRDGSIVNITSIEAHRAGPGYTVYAAMKAAVANLTKSLALEFGPQGIRVNCVAPDVIATPGVGMDMPDGAALLRAGHVDDVAGVVAFLAGDLSSFVTGTTVHVDGGNLAAGGWRRRDDGTFSPS